MTLYSIYVHPALFRPVCFSAFYRPGRSRRQTTLSIECCPRMGTADAKLACPRPSTDGCPLRTFSAQFVADAFASFETIECIDERQSTSHHDVAMGSLPGNRHSILTHEA